MRQELTGRRLHEKGSLLERFEPHMRSAIRAAVQAGFRLRFGTVMRVLKIVPA